MTKEQIKLNAIIEFLLDKRKKYAYFFLMDEKSPAWLDFDEAIEFVEDIKNGNFCFNCETAGFGKKEENFFGKVVQEKFYCFECGQTTSQIRKIKKNDKQQESKN